MTDLEQTHVFYRLSILWHRPLQRNFTEYMKQQQNMNTFFQ